MRIHDTMVGGFSHLVAFAQSGNFDGIDAVNVSIMNGSIDNANVYRFNVIVWLFLIFEPFTAFALNTLLVHLTAFVGMYLLLSEYLPEGGAGAKPLIVFGCSLCFALLPYVPLIGVSIAGEPLVLFAFLNLLKGKRQSTSLIIAALYPFYSHLVTTGIFVLFGLSLILVWDFIRKRRLNRAYFGGLLLLTGAQVLVESGLISNMFFRSGFISHRTEWAYFWHYSWKDAVHDVGLPIFVYGQDIAVTLHTPILIISFSAILLTFVRRLRGKKTDSRALIGLVSVALVLSILVCIFNPGGLVPNSVIMEIDSALRPIGLHRLSGIFTRLAYVVAISVIVCIILLVAVEPVAKFSFLREDRYLTILFTVLAVTLFISFFHGFYNWRGLIPVKDIIPVVKYFQLDRFYFLHPLLWGLIFALSLSLIFKEKRGRWICSMLIIAQIYYIVINNNHLRNQFTGNVRVIINTLRGKESEESIFRYRQFFSEKLFKEIEEFIGKPKEDYRVVGIGMYPDIPIYNGFYTLDGYTGNYPIEYKHQFRKAMERELEKSQKWKDYFDTWGNHCYLFVAELDNDWFHITKHSNRRIENLELNTAVLKEMGARYIFSAVEIVNAEENGLKSIKTFERDDSPWRIHVYATE